MKRIMICAITLAVGSMLAHAAQLYRWVDDKGNVEWRDTPPPATAKKVEQRQIRDNVISTGELPYSVQMAAKNFPVTLWTTDCGDACNQARGHLNKRGIPYTEKNPQSDLAGFKKIAGSTEVPFLEIGNNKLKGYQQTIWDSALDDAGYPKTALVTIKPPPKPPAAEAPKAAEGAGTAPAQTPPPSAATTPPAGK